MFNTRAARRTLRAVVFRLTRQTAGDRPAAERLAAARPDRADVIARQLERLIAPDQMGELFKAACIHSPDWTPPAFEED